MRSFSVTLPPDHEHAYNAEKLRKEEEEYQLAYRLLCPTEFVVKTFLDKGFAKGNWSATSTGLMRRCTIPAATGEKHSAG